MYETRPVYTYQGTLYYTEVVPSEMGWQVSIQGSGLPEVARVLPFSALEEGELERTARDLADGVEPIAPTRPEEFSVLEVLS